MDRADNVKSRHLLKYLRSTIVRADAMPESAAPLIDLDSADATNAPALSYNVQDPTSFRGRELHLA